MKFKLNKIKWFAAIISLLSSVMSFSIGFGLWSISSVDTDITSGSIQVETVEDGITPVSCISNVVFNGFQYSKGYGFPNESTGAFVASTDFAGTFVLNVNAAKTCISSLTINKTMSIKIEFTSSVTSNFTFGNPTLGGLTNSPVSRTVTDSSATKAIAYNITLTDSEYASTSLLKNHF